MKFILRVTELTEIADDRLLFNSKESMGTRSVIYRSISS